MSAWLRRRWRVLAAVAATALVVVAIGPRGQPGEPFDPRSTAPTGTRGLVEVMARLGTAVDVGDGVPTDATGVTLVIRDTLRDEQREGLRRWIDGGGTLVLADPLSELAPSVTGTTDIAFTEPTIEPACDDPAVAGVRRVAVSGALVFALPDGAAGCFPRNDGWFMVRERRGSGAVVALGGPVTLTNELLDDEDTAVLLVNLLTPTAGDGLLVLRPDPEAAGDATLAQVLPDQVGLALLQIVVVWVLAVWWQGRRHGRPVEEALPVRLEAAETTLALGNLLQRAGQATDAASVLRSRLEADLRARMGLPDPTPLEDLAAVAEARAGIDAARLLRLLTQPPTSDAALVAYAADVAMLRSRLRRGASPPTRAVDPTVTAATTASPTGAPVERPADT